MANPATTQNQVSLHGHTRPYSGGNQHCGTANGRKLVAPLGPRYDPTSLRRNWGGRIPET